MYYLETNKAFKTVVNFTIDDVGISGLPVKLDLYNETANTWFNGATWVASKPSSLNMTDDGAKFNGRYYYSWTPNLDGYYVAYSTCISAGYEFQLEQDYESVKLMGNVESISAMNTTINSKVDILDTNVDTIKADIEGKVYNTLDTISGDTFDIIGDIAEVYSLVQSFANIGSISADVLSGGIYEENVTIKDIDVNGTSVYVVYKNADGKLKVIQTPFTQGVVIASGVDQ